MRKNVQLLLPKKQQGVVLIVSLVFLIALTGVAAALMQNTTTDMKMSGASEEKMVATQEAISAVDEVIFNQVAPGATNTFAQPIVNFPVDAGLLPGTKTSSTASVDIINNQYGLEADCPHSRLASSTQVFTCNVLSVQVNRNYGRKKNSTVNVNSGIAQQLLR
ncbi:pilus assembly PilX family protein [Thalassotalea sp. PLHSN55]|uniref:pilus assembly PilX family protein n=1 Tax=Thalassotalea sp. PLHSN55 TaxID=3435888 RepID=UPI003F870945